LEAVVASEKFTYSMKDLCDELDQRIERLERFREKLEARISDSIGVTKNRDSLSRVANSLTYARQARSAMQSSCCDYSCDFELQDQ
jgi:hypothetical protein